MCESQWQIFIDMLTETVITDMHAVFNHNNDVLMVI